MRVFICESCIFYALLLIFIRGLIKICLRLDYVSSFLLNFVIINIFWPATTPTPTPLTHEVSADNENQWFYWFLIFFQVLLKISSLQNISLSLRTNILLGKIA